MMNKLKKPDGTIVEVNDKSLEYALSLGWKPIKEVKKRGPRNSTNAD